MNDCILYKCLWYLLYPKQLKTCICDLKRIYSRPTLTEISVSIKIPTLLCMQ